MQLPTARAALELCRTLDHVTAKFGHDPELCDSIAGGTIDNWVRANTANRWAWPHWYATLVRAYRLRTGRV